MPNIESIDTDTWEDLEERIRKIRADLTKSTHYPPTIIFRGHACSTWGLETTLERYGKGAMSFADYYRIISRVRPAIEALTEKTWPLSPYPEIEDLAGDYDSFSLRLTASDLPGYEYMAYLRHHGFPSPLLDWTQSLYVAAYFAFRAVPTNKRLLKGGKVSIFMWVDPENKVSGSDYRTIFHLGPYIRAHRRHGLQQSHYTVCLGFKNDGWYFATHKHETRETHDHENRIRKFNIPTHEYQNVLKSLDEHNLNGFSLFDSEEGLMESLAIRELDLKGPD